MRVSKGLRFNASRLLPGLTGMKTLHLTPSAFKNFGC